MPVIKDQDNIEKLRKRLYSRGEDNFNFKRKSLSSETFDVSRGWAERPTKLVKKAENLEEKKIAVNQNEHQNLIQNSNLEKATTPSLDEEVNYPSSFNQNSQSQTPPILSDPKIKENNFSTKPMVKKDKTSFGFYFLLATLVVSVVGIFASLYFLFSGTGQISAKNISLEINAPFAVAGGDKLPLQLVVANQNEVGIESVSLVLKYPEGSRSGDGEERDLFEERIPLENIKAGEVKNVPIEVILFGEENTEKEINARIEYRIENSNSFFQKAAEPIFVKLNSSALVLKIDAVEKISAGQEMDVLLTVSSNSSNPLKNILVKANFPNNFSLIRSDPEVVFGQNAWHFDEISPNQTYTVKIRGLVNGFVGEVSDIKFEAGSVRADNKYEIASVLNQTKSSFVIEQSFIDVVVSTGGRRGSEVVLSGNSASVDIEVINTLREPIYDMRIEVEPQGNIFSEDKLSIKNGFYNASTRTINWESSGVSDLKEVSAGKSVRTSFSLNELNTKQYNPSFDVSVKVFAKRVSEARANEEQIGSGVMKVKFSSGVSLNNEIAFKSSPFGDNGPIPPIVNKNTNYTITFEAVAGFNDLKNGVLTTSFPPFVDFVGKYDGEGKVEYNPVSKQLRWELGEISANERKQLQFQVSVLPTITQVGSRLDIVNRQSLTITDSFTETNLSASAGVIKNTLSSELGFGARNDIVQSE